jgi:hypothetical protein
VSAWKKELEERMTEIFEMGVSGKVGGGMEKGRLGLQIEFVKNR